MTKPCPCDSQKNYKDCCGAFLEGRKKPDTPEALMRSRYTAYTQDDIEYLGRTMKSPAADHFDPEISHAKSQQYTWLKLEVLHTSHSGNTGIVEFKAHFMYQNKHHVMHEISDFRKDEGEWFYVSGKGPNSKEPVDTIIKVGRNDLCFCGSNKKYKKCCGK